MNRNSKLTAQLWRAWLVFLLILIVTSQQCFVLAETSIIATNENIEQPFTFSVLEIEPPNSHKEKIVAAPVQPLSDSRALAILSRLKSITSKHSANFALPEDSLVRPPIPGNQIAENFPPKETSSPRPMNTSAPAPLKVVHVSHEGVVDNIDQFSITFSQPMVPVSEAKETNPQRFVSLTPQPPGVWRWAGSQTLIFDPANGRFPKSTSYEVSVHAGVTSSSGGKIDETRTWPIETTPVKVSAFQPQDSWQLEQPVLLAVFDQDVDRKAVLKTIHLVEKSDSSSKETELRLVDDTRIDATLKSIVSELSNKRWMAFEPVRHLPLATEFQVIFGPNCPSAEGPLLTSDRQEFTFSTYGSFQCTAHEHLSIAPGAITSATIPFSNPIDKKTFSKDMVKVIPAIPDFNVVVNRNHIFISGELRARCQYSVEFDKRIKDIFGQSLKEHQRATIETSAFLPQISSSQQFITIPRGKDPVILLNAQGCKFGRIKIYRATPNEWSSFSTRISSGPPIPDSAPLVESRDYPVGDQKTRLNINLSRFLRHGCGQFIITAEPKGTAETPQPWSKSAVWVQVTNISLDTINAQEIAVLATSLADGSPLQNVKIQLLEQSGSAVSDSAGIAKLPVPQHPTTAPLLVATSGDDIAILPTAYRGPWTYHPHAKKVGKWYAVSDRKLYKPGEQVSVKGWVRSLQYSEKDAIKLLKPRIQKVFYIARGIDCVELAKGSAEVDESSGFSFSFQLPKKINLGGASIWISDVEEPTEERRSVHSMRSERPVRHSGIGLESTTVPIQIADFRRPEFEMSVTSSAGNSMMLGESTTLSAKANYFAGDCLRNSNVDWTVTCTPTAYSPPGWAGYRFSARPEAGRHSSMVETKKKAIKTNNQGVSSLQFRVDHLGYPTPVVGNFEATVHDVNRQAWSDRKTVLVHPADVYVGLKSNHWFTGNVSDPIELNVIVTNIDGKPIVGKKVVLKILWKQNQDEQSSEVEHRTIESSAEATAIRFVPAKSGAYSIVASVVDNKLRANQSDVTIHVAGSQPFDRFNTHLQSRELLLTSDKDEYESGETAEVKVTAPFFPTSGLMAVRRNVIVSSAPVRFDQKSASLRIPISEDCYPNTTVTIIAVGSDFQFASGTINLKVPPKRRSLKLQVSTSQPVVIPGADTSIQIDLKDCDGKPIAQGQVAITVVDDALLALCGYKWADPLLEFFPEFRRHFIDNNLHQSLWVTEKAKRIKEVGIRVGGFDVIAGPRDMNLFQVDPTVIDERHYTSGRAERHEKGAQISLRSQFAASALYQGSIVTDGAGKATVKLHLPDSVTKYRIMAVAASGPDNFALAESNITARLPLMVKPSPPRFLQFGDRCELPVVLQNQTDNPLKVEVAMRASNANLRSSKPTSSADDRLQVVGHTVMVPSKDRVEVRFPIATSDYGEAVFQCAAVAGDLSDASEWSIPVMMPASSETFATYGEIDKSPGIAHKLECPSNSLPNVGGLSLSASSTQVQALTDAYFYLRDYPYGCSEQVSSRLIAMLSLEHVLSAFGNMDESSHAQYRKKINEDIEVLLSRQGDDGAIGLWSKGDDQYPYVSLQAIRAILLAQEKDYQIDRAKLDLCKVYLKNIEQHIPHWADRRVRKSLIARALNVRWLAGDSDVAKAKTLIADLIGIDNAPMIAIGKQSEVNVNTIFRSLSLETIGWLLPVISKDASASTETALLRRAINSRIRETASTASVNDTGYGDLDYLVFYSERRVDALILEALMYDQPESPIISKLVRGLLAHRKKGAWEGTQENGYILQALDRYFTKYESATPKFKVREWLGKAFAGEQDFVGRSTETKTLNVPISYLSEHNPENIYISKEGKGRLYYRIALDYAPKNLELAARNFGFAVSRNYEAVDDDGDVRRDSNGTWHFKSGALIRAKIRFSNPAAGYHVALMDPLPAGAEPINQGLSGNQSVAPTKNASRHSSHFDESNWYWWYGWRWYEHQNLRDHQAEAFASRLSAGSHEYSYLMRATTPGKFIVPPSKLEEMYAPETFGRCKTDHVVIE